MEKLTTTTADSNCTNNSDESSSHPIENETIESWTFLGDESKNTIHHGSGEDNIVEHHEDTKFPPKASHNRSSCLSDNFLSVTNHAIDGDISDGISVISDCDSISDRHSPMPINMTSERRSVDDETEKSKPPGVEDNSSYTLVERSTDNEVQVVSSNDYSHRQCVWNPSNIILFGLIVGAAAILSSQCWKINSSHDTIMPEMSLLAQRIQDLESENLALKIEVNRLVELHHAGHDHRRSHEQVVEKPSLKQKKVWTGADDSTVHIPKEPAKENYCKDEYLNSDDLFANYNLKKCENIDKKVKSKEGLDNEQVVASDNSSKQFNSRRKKNFTKDDSASIRREKFAESKLKNTENQMPVSDFNENTRNDKLKIQEEHQKLVDEATQKYLERQTKMETKQEKGRKYRDDILKESKNSRKQPKDIDSEWYDKMMKQREELRAMGGNSGGNKQRNKENWYTERADGREKVRGKHEKQMKSKQYR